MAQRRIDALLIGPGRLFTSRQAPASRNDASSAFLANVRDTVFEEADHP